MLPALILFMVIESHMTFWVTAELKMPPENAKRLCRGIRTCPHLTERQKFLTEIIEVTLA
ncbi:hypothetical protein GYMC10_5627 [Paenibacillus sp. Y412MC10]|nr:hypothetical protein GYMC10_5627 [Paenibacillus sp. Y412MC10]